MNRPKLCRIARRVVAWSGGFLAFLLLFIVASNLWVLRYAGDYVHERPYQPSSTTKAETVAIVPGALVRGVHPSQVLVDRLQTALELYEDGTVSKILVSGDHGRSDYDEVGAMQHWLLSHGVAEEDIVQDHAGFRTLDTMIRARKVFGVQRAIVCTQRFHLDRAVFLARRAGIDAHGLVADRRRYPAHYWNHIREALARPAAVFDSYVLGREPKCSGGEDAGEAEPAGSATPGDDDFIFGGQEEGIVVTSEGGDGDDGTGEGSVGDQPRSLSPTVEPAVEAAKIGKSVGDGERRREPRGGFSIDWQLLFIGKGSSAQPD